MRFYPKRSEGGFAHLAIVFLVVVLVVGAGIAVFVKANESSDSSQQEAISQPMAESTGGTSLQINQRNAARKHDASTLLSAVTEYVNNNSGQLPSAYEGGWITGGPSSDPVMIGFEVSKTVTFTSGAQAQVTTIGELRVVTQAACGENGEAVTGSSRSYVVQFVLEKVNGGFTSDCKEG